MRSFPWLLLARRVRARQDLLYEILEVSDTNERVGRDDHQTEYLYSICSQGDQWSYWQLRYVQVSGDIYRRWIGTFGKILFWFLRNWLQIWVLNARMDVFDGNLKACMKVFWRYSGAERYSISIVFISSYSLVITTRNGRMKRKSKWSTFRVKRWWTSRRTLIHITIRGISRLLKRQIWKDFELDTFPFDCIRVRPRLFKLMHT